MKKLFWQHLIAAAAAFCALIMFSGTAFADIHGWYTEGGKTYYYENGEAVTGWRDLETEGVTNRYYFGSDGVMQTGEAEIDGYRYLFAENGVMQTGFCTIGENTCYFNPDTGWMTVNSVSKIEGNYYYFDEYGVMQTGWQEVDGSKYYFAQESGAALIGKSKIGSQFYYFSSKGKMLTGFRTISGKTYYFRSGTGRMIKNDIFRVNGSYYYFDKDGVMQTGWWEVDGNRMYFYTNSGKAATGFKKIGNKLYYFSSKGVLHEKKGWAEISKGYYYFKSKGELATGLTEINGRKFYFDKNGKMKTGWVKIGDYRYYFKAGGNGHAPMITGKHLINGKYYYFNKNGRMQSGWVTIGKARYYFKKVKSGLAPMLTGVNRLGDGVYYFSNSKKTLGQCQSGWKTADKNRYYFSPKNNRAVTGLNKIGGKYYYFTSNGKMRIGWVDVNGSTYYFSKVKKTLGQGATGFKKVGKHYYYFTPTAKLQKDVFKTINGRKLYFEEQKGRMAVGVVKRGSDHYLFDKNGQQLTGWQIYKNNKYYLKEKSGRAVTGLVKIDRITYLFGDDGKLQTGWHEVDGKTSYFSDGDLKNQYTGSLITGLKLVKGKVRLTDGPDKDITESGTYGGKYVIVKKNGDILTGKGWTFYNGYKYYIRDDGCTVKTNVEDMLGECSFILKVNKPKCMVNVIAYDTETGKYDIPVKSFVCSPGKPTPLGRITLRKRYRWHELVGEVWGQWCVRYYQGKFFHSVYYDTEEDPNDLNVYAYNKLGTIASHGCIRLEAINAKWVYDNKSRIRMIDIYESDDPGPFGKKWAVKLPYWHTWDPTDPTMNYKCRERGCHK